MDDDTLSLFRWLEHDSKSPKKKSKSILFVNTIKVVVLRHNSLSERVVSVEYRNVVRSSCPGWLHVKGRASLAWQKLRTRWVSKPQAFSKQHNTVSNEISGFGTFSYHEVWIDQERGFSHHGHGGSHLKQFRVEGEVYWGPTLPRPDFHGNWWMVAIGMTG
ncbi:hypothetical protein HER10_EVM0012826 [Colletotrichum scovillei]|uniref:uncharacterized protein n=1 Tax=Colletotrichum scovillei TaxID=1209932 RepID=UPI0015C3A7BF|nr:uncharacterized protein HER10_EVM0012826 [Colletotrichum scovillei]KAF4772761.1 hypothetical protein HER10_EVM0012826 [Colletotrichum scovillei]